MAALIVLLLLILLLHLLLLLLLLLHLLLLAASVGLLLEGTRSFTEKNREQTDTQRANTEPTQSDFKCNSGRECDNHFYFKV